VRAGRIGAHPGPRWGRDTKHLAASGRLGRHGEGEGEGQGQGQGQGQGMALLPAPGRYR
jgi:hypothetical protein